MNIDELTAVWRSQDAAPLHDVDETLLRETLRQDQALQRRSRRLQAIVIYGTSALFIVMSALFLAMMAAPYGNGALAGWKLAVPGVSAAAALLLALTVYTRHRAMVRLEQRFGSSLRDQVRLRIAQLDYEARKSARVSVLTMLGIVGCAAAITLGSRIVNDIPLRVEWAWAIRKIVWWTILSAGLVWVARRSVERVTLPRKRRLEALLKDLDS